MYGVGGANQYGANAAGSAAGTDQSGLQAYMTYAGQQQQQTAGSGNSGSLSGGTTSGMAYASGQPQTGSYPAMGVMQQTAPQHMTPEQQQHMAAYYSSMGIAQSGMTMQQAHQTAASTSPSTMMGAMHQQHPQQHPQQPYPQYPQQKQQSSSAEAMTAMAGMGGMLGGMVNTGERRYLS